MGCGAAWKAKSYDELFGVSYDDKCAPPPSMACSAPFKTNHTHTHLLAKIRVPLTLGSSVVDVAIVELKADRLLVLVAE